MVVHNGGMTVVGGENWTKTRKSGLVTKSNGCLLLRRWSQSFEVLQVHIRQTNNNSNNNSYSGRIQTDFQLVVWTVPDEVTSREWHGDNILYPSLSHAPKFVPLSTLSQHCFCLFAPHPHGI